MRSAGYLFTMDPMGLCEFVSSIEGLQNVIEGLRGGMKYSHSYEAIRDHVFAILQSWGDGCYLTYALPTSLTIHRARKIRSNENRPIHTNELGAQKPNECKNFGRCHIPFKPMCYCALYEDISLAEVDAQLGDQCVIATFELKKDLLTCPVGELDYFRRTGETYLGSAIQSTRVHYEELTSSEKCKGQQLMDAFFAEEFIQPAKSEADYRVTAAFSDILLKDVAVSGQLDAFMYPSVAFRAGINFALTPEAEKAKLQLLEGESKVIRITEVLGYGIYSYDILETLERVNEDGSLVWTAGQNSTGTQ